MNKFALSLFITLSGNCAFAKTACERVMTERQRFTVTTFLLETAAATSATVEALDRVTLPLKGKTTIPAHSFTAILSLAQQIDLVFSKFDVLIKNVTTIYHEIHFTTQFAGGLSAWETQTFDPNDGMMMKVLIEPIRQEFSLLVINLTEVASAYSNGNSQMAQQALRRIGASLDRLDNLADGLVSLAQQLDEMKARAPEREAHGLY